MRRRPRIEEEESSLELLLDTMCNTFGGVMFIAISIFVIISGMTQIEQADSEVEEVDTVALQQQISELNLNLKELQMSMQNKTAEIETRKNIDQTDNLEKLQQLTKLLKELEIQEKALNAARIATQKALQRTRRALSSAEQQDKKIDRKIEQLEQELSKLYGDITKLKNAKVDSKKMVFKLIQSSNRFPCWIIVDKEHIYPVGPFPGGGYHSAVNVQPVKFRDGTSGNQCTIKPGQGIVIMDGNKLSNDFRKFLNTIPRNYAPMFYIYPNSAATIHKMREVLKRQHTLHGLHLCARDGEALTLVSSSATEYEY